MVAGEPNVQPVFDGGLRLRQGSGAEFQQHSRSLLELASLVSLYQPCASRASALVSSAPLNSVSQQAGEARCLSLLELHQSVLDLDLGHLVLRRTSATWAWRTCSARVSSSGSAVRYSAAMTLFGSPSSA